MTYKIYNYECLGDGAVCLALPRYMVVGKSGREIPACKQHAGLAIQHLFDSTDRKTDPISVYLMSEEMD